MKPNNFPIRPNLDGSEEIYTQTGGVSQKFTLEEAKKYANAIEVTYNELKDLISLSELIAGSYYVITDFQTCYDRPDYDQNKNSIAVSINSYFQANVEPLMVMATSENTLAPDAYQPAYPKDKIKYDFYYTSTESLNPAFGRITERIDEYCNRTDYDHRTIEFKRYKFYYYSKENPQTGTIEILNDGTVNGTATFFTALNTGDVIAFPTSNEVFFRIDSISSDTVMTVSGQSINSYGGSNIFYLANSSGNYDSYYMSNVDDPTDFTLFSTFDSSNILNNYIGDYSIHHLEDSLGDFLLANNVLKSGEFNNNKIGNGSYNNTFNDDCTDNTIGNYFYNNITDDDFDGNVIGNNFNNNLITANFQYNQIGRNFENNTIINSDFYRNQIGNDFNNNWLDSDWGFDFQNNQIGNQFNGNTIFRQFIKNRILNGYNGNQIFREFEGNDIGNGFNDNEIYQSFYNNRIKDYFENNAIGDVNDIGNGVFEENVIGNNFKGNSTLGEFSNNQIGNDFVANQTENYFTNNVIGNNTFSNNISYNFAYNKIGYNFSNNTIANDFGFGGGNTRGNIIGNNFYYNIIGEYFYDNFIQDNFNNNEIGDNFTNNNIAYNFHGTDIGYDFRFNDVKVVGISADFKSGQGIINSVSFNNPSGVDNTYNNVNPYSTSGIGINAQFQITVTSGVVTNVVATTSGQQYKINDTITILGSNFGGVNGVDDLTITVTDSTSLYVNKEVNCTIFLDEVAFPKLYYIDSLGVLNVVSVFI